MPEPMTDPNVKIKELEQELNEANQRTYKRLWGVVHLYLDVFGDVGGLQKVVISAMQDWQGVQLDIKKRNKKASKKLKKT